jgi:hypothetical protein
VPLFMDEHNNVEGLTTEAVAGANQKDMEVQGRHGVKYLKYWYNERARRSTVWWTRLVAVGLPHRRRSSPSAAQASP